ncbi:hypothetical protein [Stakelama tenebrarum]|uniref:hypothetical protein n=1 Tax=Stakelama tenebrarum TaxID=2711215 RepID=UPI002B1BD3C5|nr:hypothetical protein [Sphingosinithalassobacter tenebrarum]
MSGKSDDGEDTAETGKEAAGADTDAEAEEAPKPRRRGRPRKAEASEDTPAEGIEAALPPALGAADGEEAPKPRRRRTTKPKVEGEGEAAA